MEIRYFKEYSHHLNRDMEFKIYGNGGKLWLKLGPEIPKAEETAKPAAAPAQTTPAGGK